MLSEERKRALDRLFDGDLPDDERVQLQQILARDPEAIDWFAERALFHVLLRRAMKRRGMEQRARAEVEIPFPSVQKDSSARRSEWWVATAACSAAAALVLMMGMLFLWEPVREPTFATLEKSRAALWEVGNLPTMDGSRLGQGTLRLLEGMATLQFDSGAEVVLEAPVNLVLFDAMNCELQKGTVVSNIPESALGFRVKTPFAAVVDYGTRFAVSVNEQTRETHTQVMEGKVQVEYADSDKVVELNTGQRNLVRSGNRNDIEETIGKSSPRVIPPTYDPGPRWTLLVPNKDAYTGLVKGHESETLLYAKSSIDGRTTRVSYLGFDLPLLLREEMVEAELSLHFAPTGWGLASHVPDATFGVYGLVEEVPEWDESILFGEFPGEPSQTHLGSFAVPQGVQKGRFSIRTAALTSFLRESGSSEITFRVVRETKETDQGGLVHGFASRRHPFLPAPTLAIRTNASR